MLEALKKSKLRDELDTESFLAAFGLWLQETGKQPTDVLPVPGYVRLYFKGGWQPPSPETILKDVQRWRLVEKALGNWATQGWVTATQFTTFEESLEKAEKRLKEDMATW